MIKAITFVPAVRYDAEITEQVEYSSERVSARTLLSAMKSLEIRGLSYTPAVEIHGKRFSPAELHEIAALTYYQRNGCRSVAAASEVLAHVACDLMPA